MTAPRTVSDPLITTAHTYPQKLALISKRHAITFAEFNNQVDCVAKDLQDQGVKPGHRVAIIMSPGLTYHLGILSLIRLGAVAAPLSTRFPVRTILQLFQDIQANWVITEYPPLTNHKFFQDKLLTIKQNQLDNLTSGLVSKPGKIDLNREATILFTAGSVKPKAVVHTIGNHYFSALGANQNIPFQPGDRWLVSLPLNHIGGLALIWRSLLGGGTLVLNGNKQQLPDTIRQQKITHLSLVTAQLQHLWQDPQALTVLTQLKAILLGGGPLPQNLIQQAREAGLPLYTTYGSTEMTSQITTTKATDRKLYSAGRLLRYRQLKIGKDGEILVKGETLAKGYLDNGRINLPVDAQGWFCSGDLGAIDSEGCLKVTGRKDNMFISGGENIQPEEIEAQLCLYSGISQAVVVPVPHSDFGQRPVAFLQMTEHTKLIKRNMVNHLAKILPKFKIPDQFFSWPSAYNQSSLKIDRAYFKKLAADCLSPQGLA